MDIMERLELSVNKFIILSLFFAFSCSQKEETNSVYYNQDSLQLVSKRGFLFSDDTLFTGLLYQIFPHSSDTVFIKSYFKGKEHGIWIHYYQNGQIALKRLFINGSKEGDYKEWWENGKLKLHYIFKDDEYEGSNKEWNEKGVLVKEMNYEKGHEKGSQKVWYDNGKIKANYTIKNGRRYGLLGTKNCQNSTDSLFSSF